MKMTNLEIKTKAWEMLKDKIDLDDDAFNNTAIYFRIDDEHNLVVWCDIDYDYDDQKYFLTSIRYNPNDEVFGNDIGAEWGSEDISQEALFKTIDIVLSLYNKEAK